MYHVPMCRWCDGYEVGTFAPHLDFCSDACADRAYLAMIDNDNSDQCDTVDARQDESSAED